jgi:hypothetical protein
VVIINGDGAFIKLPASFIQLNNGCSSRRYLKAPTQGVKSHFNPKRLKYVIAQLGLITTYNVSFYR